MAKQKKKKQNAQLKKAHNALFKSLTETGLSDLMSFEDEAKALDTAKVVKKSKTSKDFSQTGFILNLLEENKTQKLAIQKYSETFKSLTLRLHEVQKSVSFITSENEVLKQAKEFETAKAAAYLKAYEEASEEVKELKKALEILSKSSVEQKDYILVLQEQNEILFDTLERYREKYQALAVCLKKVQALQLELASKLESLTNPWALSSQQVEASKQLISGEIDSAEFEAEIEDDALEDSDLESIEKTEGLISDLEAQSLAEKEIRQAATALIQRIPASYTKTVITESIEQLLTERLNAIDLDAQVKSIFTEALLPLMSSIQSSLEKRFSDEMENLSQSVQDTQYFESLIREAVSTDLPQIISEEQKKLLPKLLDTYKKEDTISDATREALEKSLSERIDQGFETFEKELVSRLLSAIKLETSESNEKEITKVSNLSNDKKETSVAKLQSAALGASTTIDVEENPKWYSAFDKIRQELNQIKAQANFPDLLGFNSKENSAVDTTKQDFISESPQEVSALNQELLLVSDLDIKEQTEEDKKRENIVHFLNTLSFDDLPSSVQREDHSTYVELSVPDSDFKSKTLDFSDALEEAKDNLVLDQDTELKPWNFLREKISEALTLVASQNNLKLQTLTKDNKNLSDFDVYSLPYEDYKQLKELWATSDFSELYLWQDIENDPYSPFIFARLCVLSSFAEPSNPVLKDALEGPWNHGYSCFILPSFCLSKGKVVEDAIESFLNAQRSYYELLTEVLDEDAEMNVFVNSAEEKNQKLVQLKQDMNLALEVLISEKGSEEGLFLPVFNTDSSESSEKKEEVMDAKKSDLRSIVKTYFFKIKSKIQQSMAKDKTKESKIQNTALLSYHFVETKDLKDLGNFTYSLSQETFDKGRQEIK